jgi:hypothetical protein
MVSVGEPADGSFMNLVMFIWSLTKKMKLWLSDCMASEIRDYGRLRMVWQVK